MALFLFESIMINLLDKAGVQLHIAGATAERITLRNTQGQMVAETAKVTEPLARRHSPRRIHGGGTDQPRHNGEEIGG